MEQTINDILDPLSSAECNTHLIMFVSDSVLMALHNPGDGDHDGCEYDGGSSICDGSYPVSNRTTGICTTGFVAREFDC